MSKHDGIETIKFIRIRPQILRNRCLLTWKAALLIGQVKDIDLQEYAAV